MSTSCTVDVTVSSPDISLFHAEEKVVTSPQLLVVPWIAPMISAEAYSSAEPHVFPCGNHRQVRPRVPSCGMLLSEPG